MTHAENYANRSAFYKSQRLVQTCIECGKQRLAQRAKANRRFCSLACYWEWNSRRRGDASPAWRGGRAKLNGYTMIYKPDHPKGKHNYIGEHVLIAEEAIGRYLPEGAEVHHHNRNRADNSRGNLVICQDHAYHALLHVRARIVEAGGNPNTQKICSRCRAVKPLEEFHRRGNRGDGRVFYCKPCQSQRYQARRQQCQK